MAKKTTPDGRGTAPEAPKKRRKTATALSRQYEDPLWQTLEERMGGRKGILEAALASPNPKAAILAEMLLDKAFSNHGTKDLARKADMGAEEMVDLYRNKKWLEATLRLHEELPDIIGGAAQDAKPKMVPCPECKTKCTLENGDKCWMCGGWGEVRKPGDKDKLNFVGEAVGMTGKRGPAVVLNQQINNTSVQQPTSFEDMVRRATIPTQRPKQIEEAQIVPSSDVGGVEGD